MTPLNYQGLFFLTLGTGSFIILALVFRIIATELNNRRSQPAGEAKPWRGKEELILTAVYEEARDVRSFQFRRANGADIPPFLAGQFISFQIGDDPKTLRSYSISTSPHDRMAVQVSVKKLAGGHGSGWFHSLKPGDRVMAHPPAGHFTDDECGAAQRIYIAGGIGITPVISMIRSHLDAGELWSMALFYGIRTEADLAFHGLLQHMARRSANFSYFPVFSGQTDSKLGDSGAITLDYIRSKINVQDDAHFLMCGPDGLTKNLIDQLTAAGTQEERIHIEKFASPAAFDRSQVPDRNLQLTYMGRALNYTGRKTILEFLEDQSVPHPYACRVGVCGACKCKATGRSEAITDAGLTPRERKEGMILPCVAFPEEDLELKVV